MEGRDAERGEVRAGEGVDLIRDAVKKLLTASGARKIRDEATRRIMAEEHCIYPIARAKLTQQRQAMRREVIEKSIEVGCTRAAAFYMLQDELTNQQENRK